MVENNENIIRQVRPQIAVGIPARLERHSREQELSLADVWRTAARQKLSILLFAGVLFCLVAIYTFFKTPVYEGVARLQIDPSRSRNLGLDDDSNKSTNADTDDSRLKTEVAIIQSDTVATLAMESLRLYANPLFAHKDTITKPISGLSQLTPSERQRLLTRFGDDLSVKVIPNTQVVEIRFRSSDPVLAAKTANSIIDEYMQRNFRTRVDSTIEISQWLSGQMDEIRASTTAAQEKLAEFQREHNFLGPDESDNIVSDRLKQLNEELTDAEADRIVKEGRYRLALSGNPELIDSAVPDTTLQLLHTQQTDLEAQYSQLGAKFGTGYPKLREVASELASVNSEIETERRGIENRFANEYDVAAKAEAMIRSDFDKQKADAYKLNESAAQYSILKHEVESGQQLYDTLQLKLKEADVASGLTSSYITVVDRAQPSDKPVAPRKALNLALGLGGGLLGGLMLGFVLDSFDDTIQTSCELEAFSALPELGSIPFLLPLTRSDRKPLKAGNSARPAPDFDPISVLEPECPGAEAYRALCSVILLSSTGPLKVLAVTSAMAGEGKSSVTCNLATVLAQRGKRVLLVDADLRCSSIHPRLGKMPGLSTVLEEGPSPNLHYQPLAHLPDLHVLPSGFRPMAPTEILASTRMQQLLEIWSAEYDHVIIDTPPMLPFADALILAARADGVILVTRSGVSRSGALLRTRDLLLRSGVNILGFVLNAVRRPEYYYTYPRSYRQLTSNYRPSESGRKRARAAGAS
jgi:polysaccharide biosynthesis transport protein